MRILQVNAFAAPVGGAEIYCQTLIDELRSRGHRVALFAGDAERAERSADRCVVQRPEFRAANLARDAELEGAFAAFAAEFRPELIHVHNVHAFSVGLLHELTRPGAPLLMTAHDAGLLCPNSWLTHGDGTVCAGGPGQKCFEHGCERNYPYDGRVVTAVKLRYEFARSCVQSFAAPSQFLADKLAAHGFPGARCLPLWVEDAEGAPRSASELPPRDPQRVLFLGRLVREKGVEYLVRAWPLVLQRLPGATLSIVGGGPEAERLAELARELGLDPGQLFTGKVPHEQVGHHLARATVQILPSIWCENSPITTYESYRNGLPMIASDIAGLPAMVRPGETGLLARPRDPVDLADKIVQLLADPALQVRLQQGCLDAARRYTREAHLEALLRWYDEGLALGPPTPEVDLDLLAATDAFLKRFDVVERWALDMQQHIQWLEREPRGR
jgi:glycosyltransferase involved in cell wall biosynthesis